MAIKTRDELLETVRNRIGDATDDEALTFIEDITDTLNDYENRANNVSGYTEEEYRALDESWRQRYRDRFFNSVDAHEKDAFNQEEEMTESEEVKTTFESLFEEGE